MEGAALAAPCGDVEGVALAAPAGGTKVPPSISFYCVVGPAFRF
jgi:hypothetical protein